MKAAFLSFYPASFRLNATRTMARTVNLPSGNDLSTLFSETNPRGELRVPRVSQSSRRNAKKAIGRNNIRQSPRMSIESVQEFEFELEIDLLPDGSFFDEAQILVVIRVEP